MLVERELTYKDIKVLERDEVFKLLTENNPITDNVFGNAPSLLSKASEWSSYARFKSGYKPSAPLFRDPSDYMNSADSSISPADKQTAIEKLRAKFEGQLVMLKRPPSGVLSSTSGNYDSSMYSLRMLFYGRWRPIFNLDVLTLIANENDFHISFPVTNATGRNFSTENDAGQFRDAVDKLIEDGAITVLNEDGIGSPIWNDFIHILNPLTSDEYNEYLALTPIFEVEHIKPYEPAGSVKYYIPTEERFEGNKAIDPNATSPTSAKAGLLNKIEAFSQEISNLIELTEATRDNLSYEVEAMWDWRHTLDEIISGNLYNWKLINASNQVLKSGTNTNSLDSHLMDLAGNPNSIAIFNFDSGDYSLIGNVAYNDYNSNVGALGLVIEQANGQLAALEQQAEEIESIQEITDVADYNNNIDSLKASEIEPYIDNELAGLVVIDGSDLIVPLIEVDERITNSLN